MVHIIPPAGFAERAVDTSTKAVATQSPTETSTTGPFASLDEVDQFLPDEVPAIDTQFETTANAASGWNGAALWSVTAGIGIAIVGSAGWYFASRGGDEVASRAVPVEAPIETSIEVSPIVSPEPSQVPPASSMPTQQVDSPVALRTPQATVPKQTVAHHIEKPAALLVKPSDVEQSVVPPANESAQPATEPEERRLDLLAFDPANLQLALGLDGAVGVSPVPDNPPAASATRAVEPLEPLE